MNGESLEYKAELPNQKWLVATAFEPGRLQSEMGAGLPVPRICEMSLPLKFECWVQAVADSQCYFLIPKSLQPLLEEIRRQMTDVYNSSMDIPALSSDWAAVGKVCAAEFDSEDGKHWYRVCVEKLNKDGRTATVTYVDFGNTEEKPLAELKPLLAAFARLPPLALQCCEAYSKTSEEDFKAVVLEEAECDVVCELFSCASPPYGARLTNPRVRYGPQLLGQRTREFIHPSAEFIQELEAERLKEEKEARENAELELEEEEGPLDVEAEIREAIDNARPPSRRYLEAREKARFAQKLTGGPPVNFPLHSIPADFFRQAYRIRHMDESLRPSCITHCENWSEVAKKPDTGVKIPVVVSHVKSSRDIFLMSPEGAEQARTTEAVLATNYDADSESVPPEQLVESRACVVRDPSLGGRWIRAVVSQVNLGVSVTLRAVDRGWTLPPISWSDVEDIKVLRTIDGTYDGPACWHTELAEMGGVPLRVEETELLQRLLPEGKMVRVAYQSLKKRYPPRGYIAEIWTLPVRPGEKQKQMSKQLAKKMRKIGYPIQEPKPRTRSLAQPSSLVTMSTCQLGSMAAKGTVKLPEVHIPDAEWSGRGWITVLISHGCPWSVFVQTMEMRSEVEKLTREMNDRYRMELRLRYNTLPLLSPMYMAPGVYCVGRFTDDLLYRVQILEVMEKEKTCKVQYVDFGNRALVPFGKLFPLRPEFAQLPRQCLGPCLLEGVPMPKYIRDDVSDKMEAMAGELLRPLRYWWLASIIEDHADGQNYFLLNLKDPNQTVVDPNQFFQAYINSLVD